MHIKWELRRDASGLSTSERAARKIQVIGACRLRLESGVSGRRRRSEPLRDDGLPLAWPTVQSVHVHVLETETRSHRENGSRQSRAASPAHKTRTAQRCSARVWQSRMLWSALP